MQRQRATLTAVDAVYGIEELGRLLQRAVTIYTPIRRAEGAGMSWDTLQRAQQEAVADPWDGRLDRTRALIALLRERMPGAEIRDIGPVLDEMRLIKSKAEIDLLRKAGQLTATGIIEAMRSTRAGVMEYQLDAVMRYVYLVNGARDAGYRAIIAGGANAWYGHYNANDQPLGDGDLVLVDCAPDYRYYTSDIGRMWPVNGRYSALQRELYGFILTYHMTFLDLIRPGVTAEQILDEAAVQMENVVEQTKFSKPIYEQAARKALAFKGHLSHPVGMSVHDVGTYRGKPLQPGLVLTLDPMMWVPEEKRYIRVEDTLLITEDGFENLTQDAPLWLRCKKPFLDTNGHEFTRIVLSNGPRGKIRDNLCKFVSGSLFAVDSPTRPKKWRPTALSTTSRVSVASRRRSVPTLCETQNASRQFERNWGPMSACAQMPTAAIP
jgi:Xaa-Pro aminopeptidase